MILVTYIVGRQADSGDYYVFEVDHNTDTGVSQYYEMDGPYDTWDEANEFKKVLEQ